MTADPVETGIALKAAIAAAEDGATIVLDAGRYELGLETHLDDFRTGLLIENRRIAITRCRPTGTVTLACPQLIGDPLQWVLSPASGWTPPRATRRWRSTASTSTTRQPT